MELLALLNPASVTGSAVPATLPLPPTAGTGEDMGFSDLMLGGSENDDGFFALAPPPGPNAENQPEIDLVSEMVSAMTGISTATPSPPPSSLTEIDPFVRCSAPASMASDAAAYPHEAGETQPGQNLLHPPFSGQDVGAHLNEESQPGNGVQHETAARPSVLLKNAPQPALAATTATLPNKPYTPIPSDSFPAQSAIFSTNNDTAEVSPTTFVAELHERSFPPVGQSDRTTFLSRLDRADAARAASTQLPDLSGTSENSAEPEPDDTQIRFDHTAAKSRPDSQLDPSRPVTLVEPAPAAIAKAEFPTFHSERSLSFPLSTPANDIAGSSATSPQFELRGSTPAPASVMRQIADAVITTRDETVEITLSPEELGRVRMVLTGQERAPHLAIWAERPEILEQMRRNGDMLLQYFSDEGLHDATLNFQDDRQHGADSQVNDDPPLEELPSLPEDQATQLITAPGMTSNPSETRRIDVRL